MPLPYSRGFPFHLLASISRSRVAFIDQRPRFTYLVLFPVLQTLDCELPGFLKDPRPSLRGTLLSEEEALSPTAHALCVRY